MKKAGKTLIILNFIIIISFIYSCDVLENKPEVYDVYTDIFVVNIDGTSEKRLTFGENNKYQDPVWSPDGTKIAFSGKGDDGIYGIFIMDSNGSNMKRLTTGGCHHLFSPDGTKILFYRITNYQNYDIYLIDLTTENEIQIGSGEDPIWSPDSSKIVYRTSSTNYDLYVVNSNGSGSTKIATINGSNYNRIYSWSPDSLKIAYSDGNDLFVINNNGTNLQQITSTPELELNPIFSSVNNKIAFLKSSQNYLEQDLYVIDLDTNTTTQITNDKKISLLLNKNTFKWSPDGSKILYSKNYPAQFYLTNSNGSSNHQIFNNVTNSVYWYFDSNKLIVELGYNANGVINFNINDNSQQLFTSKENENWDTTNYTSRNWFLQWTRVNNTGKYVFSYPTKRIKIN